MSDEPERRIASHPDDPAKQLDADYWERKFYPSREEVLALIDEPGGIGRLLVAVCDEDEEVWATNGFWIVPAATLFWPQGGWVSGTYTTAGDHFNVPASWIDKLIGHVRTYREASKVELTLRRCMGSRILDEVPETGQALAIFSDFTGLEVRVRVDYLRLVLGNMWADSGVTWWHTSGNANSPVGIVSSGDGETLLGLVMPTVLGVGEQ